MRIGLVGLAGAGKDTASQIIARHLSLPCVAFAQPIHEAAKCVFGDLCLERGVKELPLPFGNDGIAVAGKMALDILKDGTDDDILSELNKAFTNPETGQIYEELSPRKFMQLFGTEFGRSIDGDLWVNLLKDKYQDAVVSDVRFENELAVCNVAVVIRRTGSGIEGNHISENLANRLSLYSCDVDCFTITSDTYNVVGFCVDNNGTIDDLRENLKRKFSKIHL